MSRPPKKHPLEDRRAGRGGAAEAVHFTIDGTFDGASPSALARTYARTALPIIFVMGMNGLLTVVDALFLGLYVGPQALAAVTLLFPLTMVFVALATLVASGMSSLLARRLGARDLAGARAVFAGAHGLALTIGLALALLVAVFGAPLVRLAAGSHAGVAVQAGIYLAIQGGAAPLMLLLSVQSDALRNEGRAPLMAGLSLLVSLANIGFNAVLIIGLDMGVAGSAWGTVLAQLLALAMAAVFRWRAETPLPLSALMQGGWGRHWSGILALGAPQSLNFLGVALVSAAIVTALRLLGAPGFAVTVSAYGIVTRIMTFGFLPLLGLAQAMQTITGTAFGADNLARTDASLRLALILALAYCAGVQAVLSLAAPALGGLFVDDPRVVAEVGRILPVMVALYLLSGPLMMIGAYFQAVGDAGRAAVLGLAKPYLFVLPLIFGLSARWGEIGIWAAGPLAEALLACLCVLVLARAARRRPARWGLFLSGASG